MEQTNKQSINVVKDKDDQILTDEDAIRATWKSYFDDLMNEENVREPLESVKPVEGPENEIN